MQCGIWRLMDARRMAGLTLRQAARVLKMDPDYLAGIEFDSTEPTAEDVARCATAYDVRVEWLLGEVSTESEILARRGSKPEDLDNLSAEDRAKLVKLLDMTA